MRKSLISAATCIVAALSVAACGGKAPAGSAGSKNVVADLNSLFSDKGMYGDKATLCAHKSGNEYICSVTLDDGSTTTADVTDDGSTIYEQGVSQ